MTEQAPEAAPGLEIVTWFLENWKKLAAAAVIAVILAGGYFLFQHLHEEREAAASQALTELRMAGNTPGAANPAKPEDYRKLASNFSGTAAAQQAEFFAATALFDAGKYDEARAAFDKFVRENATGPLAAQAAYGAAVCLEALKRPDDALAAYQSLANRYPTDGVSTQAKLAIGRIYEAKGQPEQALKLYQDTTRAAAMSAWSAEFARRQDELLRRHPKLAETLTNAAPAAPSPAPAPAAKK